ncbi:MAG: hypothetical protein FWE42_01080 [Defluviitaleaceae bacterium]|nr:hypothetical protein [Defluviitaleaceae bacterium]
MQKEYKNISAEKPVDYTTVGDDPDAKRKEEKAEAVHSNIIWIYKVLPKAAVAVLIFLLVLFVAILPLSVMELSDYSRLRLLQEWSVAFISTGSTAGATLITLIVYEVVKRVFRFLEKRFMAAKE